MFSCFLCVLKVSAYKFAPNQLQFHSASVDMNRYKDSDFGIAYPFYTGNYQVIYSLRTIKTNQNAPKIHINAYWYTLSTLAIFYTSKSDWVDYFIGVNIYMMLPQKRYFYPLPYRCLKPSNLQMQATFILNSPRPSLALNAAFTLIGFQFSQNIVQTRLGQPIIIIGTNSHQLKIKFQLELSWVKLLIAFYQPTQQIINFQILDLPVQTTVEQIINSYLSARTGFSLSFIYGLHTDKKSILFNSISSLNSNYIGLNVSLLLVWQERECPINCKTCTDGIGCVNCQGGFFLIPANKICKRCQIYCQLCSINQCIQCVFGYFISNRGCKPCSQNCLNCNSESSCIQCLTSFIVQSSVCRCPQYMIKFQNECNYCNQKYQNCVSCTQTVCLSCKQGYFLIDSACNMSAMSASDQVKQKEKISCVFPLILGNDNICKIQTKFNVQQYEQQLQTVQTILTGANNCISWGIALGLSMFFQNLIIVVTVVKSHFLFNEVQEKNRLLFLQLLNNLLDNPFSKNFQKQYSQVVSQLWNSSLQRSTITQKILFQNGKFLFQNLLSFFIDLSMIFSLFIIRQLFQIYLIKSHKRSTANLFKRQLNEYFSLQLWELGFLSLTQLTIFNDHSAIKTASFISLIFVMAIFVFLVTQISFSKQIEEGLFKLAVWSDVFIILMFKNKGIFPILSLFLHILSLFIIAKRRLKINIQLLMWLSIQIMCIVLNTANLIRLNFQGQWSDYLCFVFVGITLIMVIIRDGIGFYRFMNKKICRKLCNK